MTKQNAIRNFKAGFKMEDIKTMSKADKRMIWNDYVEGLIRDELITEKQCYSWGHPSFITS